MKRSAVKNNVRISEIFDTVSDPKNGKGFWGFIITYPQGRIENCILEYKQDSYEYVHQQIIAMRRQVLSQYYNKSGGKRQALDLGLSLTE